MGKKIPLGTPVTENIATITQQLTIEERVNALQAQMEELIKTFHAVNNSRIKDKRQHAIYESAANTNANKDGIPIGISLVGTSVKGGIHVLTVAADGYYIGINKYDSLSAAAAAASGVRRSGWTFWKTHEQRTVKEAFGKK